MRYATIKRLPVDEEPGCGWQFVYGGTTYPLTEDAVFPEEVALHAEDFFNRTPTGPKVELEWHEGELTLAPKVQAFECPVCKRSIKTVAAFTQHVAKCVTKKAEE